MLPFFPLEFVLLLWASFAIRSARSQEYGSTTISSYASVSAVPVLPSEDGEFQWPAGGGASSFPVGAVMNISWTTDWESVNLWLIINEQWDQPYSIASYYAKDSISWTVTCPDNSCEYPFLLRAVNAQGTDDEQQHGGFYSRIFWIRSTSTTTVSSLSQVSTTGNLLPSSVTQTSTSRSKKASTSPSSKPKPVPSGSDNSVAIGVGVGVGVGVALLGIGGFFLWRRYHKKNKQQYSAGRPQSEMAGSTPGHSSWSWFDATPSTANAKYGPPSYAQQAPVEADSGQNGPVEAPSWQQHPQELPAHPK